MKTNRLIFSAVLTSAIFITACQRDAAKELTAPVAQTSTNGISLESEEGPCNSDAYDIVLESRTQVGSNWEWVWSVQNPNPGNGTNGTVQDLSHWGMEFGSCFTWSSVAGAAYSYNGTTWTGFTPSYAPDPSQLCMQTPVLKFNYGTSGGAKTYYKLILNQNYDYTNSLAYYKSGRRTGCCTTAFQGVGCLAGGGDDGGDR